MMLLGSRVFLRRLIPLGKTFFSTEEALMKAPKTIELMMKHLNRRVQEVRKKEAVLNDDNAGINKEQIRKDLAQMAPLLALHE